MSDQFRVALYRAIITAALLASSTFLTVWSQTNDVKTLVIAFATVAVGTLITRFAAEGWIDTKDAQ